MVDADKFKQKIIEIILQDFKIEFIGEDFGQIIDSISETQANKIYEWVRNDKNENIAPIMKNSVNQEYKCIPLNELLIFRKELQIEGNDYRIIMIKIKAMHYIEFHIGLHKYYNSLRKSLGLTKK